jgi:hypothetical protein
MLVVFKYQFVPSNLTYLLFPVHSTRFWHGVTCVTTNSNKRSYRIKGPRFSVFTRVKRMVILKEAAYGPFYKFVVCACFLILWALCLNLNEPKISLSVTSNVIFLVRLFYEISIGQYQNLFQYIKYCSRISWWSYLLSKKINVKKFQNYNCVCFVWM